MSTPFTFKRQKHLPGLIYQSESLSIPGITGVRPLRLWLPPDYFTSEKTWPLALFFDGQNIFEDEGTLAGGWQVHRHLETRAAAGEQVPVVVGLHHGPERDAEMCVKDPYPGKQGQGQFLLDWIAETLLPGLQQKLQLSKDPAQHLVGGSSLGGQLALYTLFQLPQHFGKALVMSPALWPNRFGIFQDLLMLRPHPQAKIYLDHGQKEGPPEMQDIGDILFEQTQLMADVLDCLGFTPGKRLLWKPDPEGEHNEKSWSRRLPEALRFLYT